MNEIPEKINSFNVYKDGTKLIGISGEVTLPDLEAVTDTISGPGILGEIDSPAVGHFQSINVEVPFRILNDDMASLVEADNSVNITLRGSVQSVSTEGGTVYVGMRIILRGRNKAIKPGKYKQAAPMESSVGIELSYYKVELDGNDKIELDKLNYVYKINGKDVMAKIKSQI